MNELEAKRAALSLYSSVDLGIGRTAAMLILRSGSSGPSQIKVRI